jgi:hypothetical protein
MAIRSIVRTKNTTQFLNRNFHVLAKLPSFGPLIQADGVECSSRNVLIGMIYQPVDSWQLMLALTWHHEGGRATCLPLSEQRGGLKYFQVNNVGCLTEFERRFASRRKVRHIAASTHP